MLEPYYLGSTPEQLGLSGTQLVSLSLGKVELSAMNVKTGKTMKMHGVFHNHIKGDVDRLYLQRKDGGRW